MSSGLAPILCGGYRGGSHATCIAGKARSETHVAYVEWAEHHEKCNHCRQYSWYAPGAPTIYVEQPELMSGAFKFKNSKGEDRWSMDIPDPSVLCELGARYFTRWVRSTLWV